MRSPAAAAGAHVAGVDAVLEDVQRRRHVLSDAGFEQRHDPEVGPQLGNLPRDQVVDLRGQFSGAGDERAGDVRGALCNGWTCSVH